MHDLRDLIDSSDARASREIYLPTAEQIRAACLEIQAGWTREEERSRRVVKDGEWIVPEVRPHCDGKFA